MSVLISGYYSSADPRKLDKSGNLQTIFSGIEAKLKDDCDLMNPTFVLYTNNDYVRVNYLYCSTWDKYYFVNDISFGAGRAMELNCSVDVLMTYKETIKNLNVNVCRQEILKNKNLVDNEYIIGVQMNAENHLFSLDPFNGNADNVCFMLTVLGGEKSSLSFSYDLIDSEPVDWDNNWKYYYGIDSKGQFRTIFPYLSSVHFPFESMKLFSSDNKLYARIGGGA